MFTALTLSLALSAPVPPAGDAPPAGTPPRLMELKPDAAGKLTVTVVRTEMQKVQVAGAVVGVGGNAAPPAQPPVAVREVPVTKQMVVDLAEVKDLTISTADGKKLEKEDALKRLEKGGIVVVSGDGKPVSPTFLKVFKDDTLVLTSPELANPQLTSVPGGLRPLPAPPIRVGVPPAVQILPAQPGGAVEIQIAPAVLPVAPPVPLPAKPPEK